MFSLAFGIPQQQPVVTTKKMELPEPSGSCETRVFSVPSGSSEVRSFPGPSSSGSEIRSFTVPLTSSVVSCDPSTDDETLHSTSSPLSKHTGSIRELRQEREARSRLQCRSISPFDMPNPEQAAEASRRRMSLDIPGLHSTTSPSTSPGSIKRLQTISAESSPATPDTQTAIERMINSPRSREKFSSSVRKSSAFTSLFGADQPDSGHSGVPPSSGPSRSPRRASIAQIFRGNQGRPKSETPRVSDTSSTASRPVRKRRSTLTKLADAVVSAFINKGEQEAPDGNQGRPKKVAKKKVALKTIPAVQRQTSQPSESPPSLLVTSTELSPEQEEAVIQPLPAHIMAPPLSRMNRARRNSIMPGGGPPQLVMRKVDSKKDVTDKDRPKIDDVVFTVNQKGEMEMFEVVPEEVPVIPPGRITEINSMMEFHRALNAADCRDEQIESGTDKEEDSKLLCHFDCLTYRQFKEINDKFIREFGHDIEDIGVAEAINMWRLGQGHNFRFSPDMPTHLHVDQFHDFDENMEMEIEKKKEKKKKSGRRKNEEKKSKKSEERAAKKLEKEQNKTEKSAKKIEKQKQKLGYVVRLQLFSMTRSGINVITCLMESWLERSCFLGCDSNSPVPDTILTLEPPTPETPPTHPIGAAEFPDPARDGRLEAIEESPPEDSSPDKSPDSDVQTPQILSELRGFSNSPASPGREGTTQSPYADFDPAMFSLAFGIPQQQPVVTTKKMELPEPSGSCETRVFSVPSGSSEVRSFPGPSSSGSEIRSFTVPLTSSVVSCDPSTDDETLHSTSSPLSKHTGSIRELRQEREARSRLQCRSISPFDMPNPEQAAEASRRRMSLDIPGLHSTTSPSTSPGSIKRLQTISAESSPATPDTQTAIERMINSPRSREKFSSSVRKSSAFTSLFGADQPDSGHSGVPPSSGPSRSPRRASIAQIFRGNQGRPKSETPRVSDTSSTASRPVRKRRSTLTKLADAVVSAFINKGEQEAPDGNQGRPKKVAKKKVALKTIPAVQRQTSQPSESPPSLLVTSTELSPEQEEAVIQPLPAHIMAPPLSRMNRARRNSIMPGGGPPQLVMRKVDSKKDVTDKDRPKIDDVVFTVNQKGEMEMFEVVPEEVPVIPPVKLFVSLRYYITS
eukprot:sb/3461325/